MDILLSRVTQQAMQYAIRSGISVTTGFAIKECSKLLKQAPKSKERDDLRILQARLETRIKSIAPSIDMIECIAARGNNLLESTLSLTKDLRYEIEMVGNLLKQAADGEIATKAQSRDEINRHLRLIIEEMKSLLASIERAVPLLNLAITTSGANLSANLQSTVSPSRLLQASTFLTSADSLFTSTPDSRQQVGPTYTVKLYMLFEAHAHGPSSGNTKRQPTWKEVVPKARVKLWRIPLEQLYTLPGEDARGDINAIGNTIPAHAKAGEFAYQLIFVQDQNDGLYHEPEDFSPFDDVKKAGIRDVVPVHEISKMFYADTGKILGIERDGETNPILLLKRDVHADPPRRMLQRSLSLVSLDDQTASKGSESDEGLDDQSEIDAQFERESAPPTPVRKAGQAQTQSNWRLPVDLDPEWMALEVYAEEPPDLQSDDDELSDESSRPSTSRSDSANNVLSNAFSILNLRSSTSPLPQPGNSVLHLSPSKREGPPIKTNLSLLEMLLKLTALQQFRQESHLAIEDELINFFLGDTATTGAGADKEYRQRLRRDATTRVGFDPYDESPIKRRGEEYIRNARGPSLRTSSQYQNELAYDDDTNEYDGPIPNLDFAAQPSIERPSGYAYSPSPHPTVYQYQRTPSRSSTPDRDSTSASHRTGALAKCSSSSQSLGTPPGTAKIKATGLRAQSEPKPKSRSPLHEVMNDEE